ncbi:hypothetical protein KKF05_04485 [Patescibacteria group bacterium]|nr:hypothetical protein [Patescibacteria group bacterium]MBU1028581.1 hypothetical protein [Patescibacteria group bacterium]MBU1915663.1 hypothetical protein [Patescibacteria group bacterium]
MFLKITNRGSLNRNFLELIGFTTKRDLSPSDRTIGEFGSGTKVAAVAALRLGLDICISSTDHRGSYRLSFESENVDLGDGATARQIFFVYRNRNAEAEEIIERKVWHVTIDAFKDWDQPIGRDQARAFKVLREFICNAYDADPAFEISWVDDAELDYAPANNTTVYIRKSDEVRYVFDHVTQYFKFLSPDHLPLVSVSGCGRIYPKSDSAGTRLFVRGVMVNCTRDSWNSGLYDYDLDDKGLVSEDRTIKNSYNFNQALGKLIAGISDVKLLQDLLSQLLASKALLEAAALGYVLSLSSVAHSAWLRALRQLLGTKLICVASGNRIIDQDANQLFGYVVLSGNLSLKSFFSSVLKLPKADDIISQDIKYSLLRFQDFNAVSQRNFQAAFRVFAALFPARARLPIVFFLPKNKDVRKKIGGVAGLGQDSFKEIWIAALSETKLRSAMDLLRCLIHESRHVTTGAYDYDRRFVEVAEDDILRLAMLALDRQTDLDGQALPKLKERTEIEPNIVTPHLSVSPGRLDFSNLDIEEPDQILIDVSDLIDPSDHQPDSPKKSE